MKKLDDLCNITYALGVKDEGTSYILIVAIKVELKSQADLHNSPRFSGLYTSWCQKRLHPQIKLNTSNSSSCTHVNHQASPPHNPTSTSCLPLITMHHLHHHNPTSTSHFPPPTQALSTHSIIPPLFSWFLDFLRHLHPHYTTKIQGWMGSSRAGQLFTSEGTYWIHTGRNYTMTRL